MKITLVGKSPWMRAWQPPPVFLPGESLWKVEPDGLQSMGLQSQTQLTWLSIHTRVEIYEKFLTGKQVEVWGLKIAFNLSFLFGRSAFYLRDGEMHWGLCGQQVPCTTEMGSICLSLPDIGSSLLIISSNSHFSDSEACGFGVYIPKTRGKKGLEK